MRGSSSAPDDFDRSPFQRPIATPPGARRVLAEAVELAVSHLTWHNPPSAAGGRGGAGGGANDAYASPYLLRVRHARISVAPATLWRALRDDSTSVVVHDLELSGVEARASGGRTWRMRIARPSPRLVTLI